jgi:bifunctional NMN adenylyltransferase/nudix hydrolase
LDPNTAKIVIVGHRKDASSFYLDYFPKYELYEVKNTTNLNGTEIRDRLFDSENGIVYPEEIPFLVDAYLSGWQEHFADTYENLCNEWKFIRDYKQQFSKLAYPPVFVTSDAVVIDNGHILLVKRRAHPGKGLWALPGGFLNQNERIEQAIIRELKEETKIGVSDVLLRASLKGTHVFDHPHRSLRGRTITHAGLFILNTPELPKIKGSDDAEKAKWVPLSRFYEMTDMMFEDHYSIGTYMISRAG